MLGLSSNIVLLTFLYFIQGLPYGFQARFLPILLRTQGVSLTNLGFFKLLLAPWLCKAMWAPLVDKYGTKRKWLLGSVLGLVGTCFIGSFVEQHQLIPLCGILFLLNVFAATQDIAVDGLAVAVLSNDELGKGNTAQVVGYKIGSIFGGGVLLWCLDWIGWSGMFLVLTALYIEAFMFVFVSPSIRQLETKPMNSEEDSASEGQFDDADDDDSDEVFISPKHTKSPPLRTPHENQTHSNNSTSFDKKSSVSEQSSTDNDTNRESSNSSSQTAHQWLQELLLTLLGCDALENFSFVGNIISVPGTGWMMIYVLIYKLGEQGALGMLPLFLIDQQMPAQDVSFWTGLVGQGMSILGSVIGGFIITKYRFPVHLLLQQFCLMRLLPLGVFIMLVSAWKLQLLPEQLLFVLAVLLMNLTLLLSGMITTATFTFMMHCSQLAPSTIQATHYTTLATLEVFGKLMFMTVAGWLVDLFGYPVMFVTFALLAFLVMPCLISCPDELRMEKEDGDLSEEKFKTE